MSFTVVLKRSCFISTLQRSIREEISAASLQDLKKILKFCFTKHHTFLLRRLNLSSYILSETNFSSPKLLQIFTMEFVSV